MGGEDRRYRHDKIIEAHDISELHSRAVIRISGEDELEENWHKEILSFINLLKDSGKLKNYNQIAFLFNSVKNDRVIHLADFLESNNINVYSPRSNMFFNRSEIKAVIGCLLLIFPDFHNVLINSTEQLYSEKLVKYYNESIEYVFENILNNNTELVDWMREKCNAHAAETMNNTDYGFSELFYQLLAFSPFREYLDSDLKGGVTDLRPLRNLALFSQILNKFEYLHNVSILSAKSIKKDVKNLFAVYLRLLFEEGIDEYEDDSEYAPSGCVSFLTIHQSKGLEFPIVIVGVDNVNPRDSSDALIHEVEKKYFMRKPFEPLEDIKFFDFWRLYYTAFSRAQDLLVLTSRNRDGKGKQPSRYFWDTYNDLVNYDSSEFDVSEFSFSEVKDVNLKQTYSFTSHILLYNRCPLQYKFFKDLEFSPSRIGSTIFGTIVHQTIEDVHKAALKDEADTITDENIEKWLRINYETISRRDHYYLGEGQICEAVKQVQRYVKHEKNIHKDWSHIVDAEVNVGLVKDRYILEGTIDLIKGDGDLVDIVDFKSEKKPDMHDDYERIDLYRKQLNVYAHLVEERYNQKVGKMYLYYTSTEDENPKITFENNPESIEETINEFERIVDKIQNKEYNDPTCSKVLCSNCDFRYFCKYCSKVMKHV